VSLRQSPNRHRRKRSLKQLIESGTVLLEKHKIDQPRRNAEILLAHILQKPLHHIYTSWEETVSADLARTYVSMLKRRAAHVPVQYITGEVDFFGRKFIVRKGVLIPRPETEILVEKTLKLYKKYLEPARVKILDVGTGCGNVAVSLAAEIEKCSVVATDISLKALKLSCLNAVLHKVEKKIEFRQANLFPAEGDKFHIIASNPPYVPCSDISSLDEEVRKEPLRALNGGDGGTRVIEKILKRADSFLYAGGFLVMEIGYGQAEFVRNLHCGMKFLTSEKDLAGIERVAVFRKA